MLGEALGHRLVVEGHERAWIDDFDLDAVASEQVSRLERAMTHLLGRYDRHVGPGPDNGRFAEPVGPVRMVPFSPSRFLCSKTSTGLSSRTAARSRP